MRKQKNVLFALLVLAGCGGDGPSPIQPATYPSPAPEAGEVLNDTVGAQVTQSAVDFLRSNLALIVGPMVDSGRFGANITHDGDRVHIAIDESAISVGGVSFRDGCLGPNTNPCPADKKTETSKLSIDLAQLGRISTARWLVPDAQNRPGLRIEARNFGLYLDLVFASSLFGSQSVCHLVDRQGLAALNIPYFAVDLRIRVQGEGSARRLNVALENLKLDDPDLENTDSILGFDVLACNDATPIGTPGRCHDSVCSGSACTGTCGFYDAIGNLGGFLANYIPPLLDAVAPIITDTVNELLDNALGDTALAVEGMIDAKAITPLLARARPVNLFAGLGANPTIAGAVGSRGRGLRMTGDIGLGASGRVPCAMGATAPDIMAMLGTAPEHTGYVDVIDGRGRAQLEPYHIAAHLSEATIQQAVWNFFASGYLCLALDAHSLDRMLNGQLILNATLLRFSSAGVTEITHQDAPLLLTISMNRPPNIRIGRNALLPNGVMDPLLEITSTGFGLGIYYWIDGSYTRLAELTADLSLKLKVDRSPANALEIALVEEPQITNIKQVYNEVAPAADLSSMFSGLLDLGLGIAGDQLKFPVDVSGVLREQLGVSLSTRINTVHRVYGEDGHTFVALYLTLCTPEDEHDTYNSACYIPPPAGTSLQMIMAPTFGSIDNGRALFTVPRASEGYEYQYRVAGGMWHAFTQPVDGTLEIQSPHLKTEGEHLVEFRARKTEQYMTRLDLAPTPVTIASDAASEPVVETTVTASHEQSSVDKILRAGGCVQTPGPSLLVLALGVALMNEFRRKRR